MISLSNKEKADNAIKWLEALLSGEYKQATERLEDIENGFCCWGLGCYITGRNYIPKDEWDTELSELIGFNSSSGILKNGVNGYKDLSYLNDELKTNFKDIAKHLIKHAEDEFEPYIAKSIKFHFKFKNYKNISFFIKEIKKIYQ